MKHGYRCWYQASQVFLRGLSHGLRGHHGHHLPSRYVLLPRTPLLLIRNSRVYRCCGTCHGPHQRGPHQHGPHQRGLLHRDHHVRGEHDRRPS